VSRAGFELATLCLKVLAGVKTKDYTLLGSVVFSRQHTAKNDTRQNAFDNGSRTKDGQNVQPHFSIGVSSSSSRSFSRTEFDNSSSVCRSTLATVSDSLIAASGLLWHLISSSLRPADHEAALAAFQKRRGRQNRPLP